MAKNSKRPFKSRGSVRAINAQSKQCRATDGYGGFSPVFSHRSEIYASVIIVPPEKNHNVDKRKNINIFTFSLEEKQVNKIKENKTNKPNKNRQTKQHFRAKKKK